jgi:transposase
MKARIVLRPLTQDEHRQIQAGLRSSEAFVLRRCQILLASALGERASPIARHLGCDDQTVRHAIKGFNATGLAVLKEGSSRPYRLRTTFPIEAAKQRKALLHRSLRDFGLARGLWTLEHAARIRFEQGILPHQTSVASVRRALQSVGTSWKRATHGMTSPDPQYQHKKPRAIG